MNLNLIPPGAVNVRAVDSFENNRLWDTFVVNLLNRNTRVKVLDNLCAQLGVQHDSSIHAWLNAFFKVNHESKVNHQSSVNHQCNVNLDTRHFTTPSVLLFLFATTFLVMSFVLAIVVVAVNGHDGMMESFSSSLSAFYDCLINSLTFVIFLVILLWLGGCYFCRLSEPQKAQLSGEDFDKCVVCNKDHLSDDMVTCVDCGDMRLCCRCFVHSHNGHHINENYKKRILLIDNGLIELYSPSDNTSQLLDIAIQEREDHVTGVLKDGTVIVAGGHRDRVTTAATELIGLASKQVTIGPSMTFKRKRASSAMINGELYICGGWDENGRALNSSEVFRDGRWMNIASMRVSRAELALVALDEQLYAIGGCNTTDGALNSVECYSPVTNVWRPVAPLNRKRHFLSAAALDGYIFVAGGGAKWVDFYSAVCGERYSPVANQWERVANMNKARARFSLVPFGAKLYALAGDAQRSVESWEPNKMDGWSREEITLKTNGVRSAAIVNYDT